MTDRITPQPMPAELIRAGEAVMAKIAVREHMITDCRPIKEIISERRWSVLLAASSKPVCKAIDEIITDVRAKERETIGQRMLRRLRAFCDGLSCRK